MTEEQKKGYGPETAGIPTVESYLKRAYLFLEDGDWEKADEYLEKVLDADPENARAYLGKLMAQLRVPKQEQLRQQARPFHELDAFKKAVRFGDEKLKATLYEYVAHIQARNDEIAYETGCAYMAKDTREGYQRAIEEFNKIPNYTGVPQLLAQCQQRFNALQTNNETKKGNAKRKVIAIAACLCVLGILAVLFFAIILPAIRDNDTVQNPGSCEQATQQKDDELDTLDTQYNEAVELVAQGHYREALAIFDSLDGYPGVAAQADSLREKLTQRDTVSAGGYHTVGLKADGTVVFTGCNDSGNCDVGNWTDIVAVSAGGNHTVGLKRDGTVVATGDNYNSQCDVSGWTDIIAVTAGWHHTVGLKADGTVVATGWNDYDQCNVGNWTDIIAVSAYYYHTVGLKADGTVVATGYNSNSLCDVSGWTDIIAVSAGNDHTVGLKADGTVVATGSNGSGRCDVGNWTDIVAISVGERHTVGLKRDGTVVATGDNHNSRCDVSGWTDIVAVSAGSYHTVGLKADGTVVATGENYVGQCDVTDWKDIKLPE